MYAAIATLGLSFLLTFFSVGVSEAELWICSQPGGGTLFTDVPQTEGSCQKHEPVSQLNYAPPRNWANVPPSDATYEWPAANVPDAQWESRSDEQETVPSNASGGYSPEQSSFWGYDQNPIFTFYSYTPGFYGVPYFRHKYQRDLPHKPQRQHEIPHISSAPFNSTQTASTHFREHSIRPIAPGAPPHSALPSSSTHARESSVAVASGAQRQSASTTAPSHVQRNSEVAKALPQSSSPTSSAQLREHSGEAGVHGAPPQSVGFRQDTKH